MVQKIYVVGYYNHSNAGDEQYKRSFKKLFTEHLSIPSEIVILDCDVVCDTNFNEDDLIVLGGGDVLNDYFLDKLIAKFTGKCNKIIAISVGTPFLSIVKTTNKLDIIDYFFIRTLQDYDLFCDYFSKERVCYIPDLSVILPASNENSGAREVCERLNNIRAEGKQIITFAFTSDILNTRFPVEASKVIGGLIEFTSQLVEMGYHIVFVPFNCNPNNPNENDNNIHNDIICDFSKKIQDTSFTVIKTQLHESDIFDIVSRCDYVIPMRFHACLFALYNRIPFMPIFTSRKVQNLLLDVKWNHGYKLTTNEYNVPVNFDSQLALSRFLGLKKSAVLLKEKKFNDIEKQLQTDFARAVPRLNEVVGEARCCTPKKIVEKWDGIIENAVSALNKIAEEKGFAEFRSVTDRRLQETIVQVASYYLTSGSIASKYNYGLLQKMFREDYKYIDEFRWIMSDCAMKRSAIPLVNNPQGLYNLGYIDQVDYSGAHRSGWQFVYDSIKRFHNGDKILLDLYVDRTFHWQKEINEIIGVIPYTKPWVGVVHHTFDTSFSEYNCHNLLKSDSFIKSLGVCKGLIVLSKYLRKQLQIELRKRGVKHVPVFVLTHPTSTDVVKWDWKRFMNNCDKRLVHVGGWLRDIYSFYRIVMPKDTGTSCLGVLKPSRPILRKVALRGKGMSNYYPSSSFLDDLYKCLIGQTDEDCHKNICNPNASNICCPNASTGALNAWCSHFYNDARRKVNSVEIVDHMPNSDYDVLLSENIVYIYLVDASAVNTVIECIARCTPIIVNRHPAVVELLGAKYPLYIEDNLNLSKRVGDLTSYRKIKNAHRYLQRLQVPQIQIDWFVTRLNDIMSRVQQTDV